MTRPACYRMRIRPSGRKVKSVGAAALHDCETDSSLRSLRFRTTLRLGNSPPVRTRGLDVETSVGIQSSVPNEKGASGRRQRLDTVSFRQRLGCEQLVLDDRLEALELRPLRVHDVMEPGV